MRERLATGVAPGRCQILAAINAVHTSARQARDTDWSQIVALYDQFVRLDPSPIIALNRAAAVAELDGPGGGAGRRRPSGGQVGGLFTPTMRPAPTCYAGWAIAGNRARRTSRFQLGTRRIADDPLAIRKPYGFTEEFLSFLGAREASGLLV